LIAGLIKSAHDVSLGGIITAISKMCIKGNKGINLKKPKYLISDIEYFFSEDQGRYLIEITKKDLKKVTNILDKNAVHYDELGVINEDQLYINEKSKITIDELKSSNTSWLNNFMVINMAMDLKEIKSLIKEALSDATVEIQDLAGDGNHYSATVTSAKFSGKSKIEQHKMVYNSLKGKMGNELHALAIKTKEQ
jgi:stress-induced morphogen